MLNSVVALFNAGAAPAPAGVPAYESIAKVTVGSGGSSSVSFTSIAADWTHLQVRMFVKDTAADTSSETYMTINGTNMERTHQLIGNGSVASVTTSTISAIGDTTSNASGQANMFGVFIIDILDYTNTNKNKVIRALNGVDRNGGGVIKLVSGLRASTSAVTSLTFTLQSSRTFAQYSHFALYGIKGAA